MTQFIKCLTIVALVATAISAMSQPKPPAPHHKLIPHPKPKAVVVVSTVTPAPVVSQAQPLPNYSPGCQAYLPLVQGYPWNAAIALAIMQAESGCRVDPPSNAYLNVDGISDYGLMQLHGVPITDPVANVAYAYYHKYIPAHGFTPWNTYTSGKYLKYLR